MHTNADIGRRWVEAVFAGDLEAALPLCAAEFFHRQNGGPGRSLEAVVLAMRGFRAGGVPDLRVENVVCTATDTGFVDEHETCGTLLDGLTFRIFVCVVGRVVDGRIAQVREYSDSAQAAPIRKALSSTGPDSR